MIPTVTTDLDDLVCECQRQTAEVSEIFAELSTERARQKPTARKWSAAGHLAHLILVNRAYVSTLESTVDRARAEGAPRSDGPFRYSWFSAWFARSQAPPPRLRMRTFRAMVPDPEVDVDDAMDGFKVLQRRLVEVIQDSRGLDLGEIRFRSPLLARVRLSLGTGYGLVLLHNRRHVWLIHEVNRSLPPG